MNTSSPQHPAPDPRRWLTLAIVASALFMICVDMTVLYTALPVLTRELQATAAQRLWIVNVYALVVAGLLPGLGTLGDRYGHRRLFLAGLAVFGAASLGAAFSPSPAWLIAARALLGAGGAAMMPATLAIIRQRFEDPSERSFAIGLWAGTASGGLALGPVIGGLLLEHHTWGSVFLVNLPVVLAAVLLTLRYVPATRPGGGARWDLAGSLLVMTGIFGIVFAIKECARRPLSPSVLALALGVSVLFLALYARQQRHRDTPLIDVSLFRLPGFPAAVAGAALGTAGIVGFELVLGQHLQLVLGRSPLQAGLTILPTPLGSLLAGPLMGRLLRHWRASHVGAGGLLLSAAAALCLAGLSFDAGLTPGIIALLLAVGAGVGAAATAASTAIMSVAPPARAGMAASIEEVGFELGSALGVAVFGSLMTIAYATSLSLPAELANLTGRVQDALDDALRVAATLAPDAGATLGRTARAAFRVAFHAVLIGAALLWAATAAFMLLDGRRRVGANPPPTCDRL
jgi:DHA2 family multidrug resistance protein-like MFS transporter